jgi:methionine-gamma-lyase
VNYLGLLPEDAEQYRIYKKQCSAPGAMITMNVKGGEKEAFQLLNNLKLVKLAVSLGGTESLAQHPDTMTHAGVDAEQKKLMNITSKMVRLSVGVEDSKDLIWDLKQALEKVIIEENEVAYS